MRFRREWKTLVRHQFSTVDTDKRFNVFTNNGNICFDFLVYLLLTHVYGKSNLNTTNITNAR